MHQIMCWRTRAEKLQVPKESFSGTKGLLGRDAPTAGAASERRRWSGPRTATRGRSDTKRTNASLKLIR